MLNLAVEQGEDNRKTQNTARILTAGTQCLVCFSTVLKCFLYSVDLACSCLDL